MKLSSKLLIGLMLLLAAGLLVSNLILKNEYDKMDKDDKDWEFTTISKESYKHINISGGNICKIIFAPNQEASVKFLKREEEMKSIQIKVLNDTLYIHFPDSFMNKYPKNQWLRSWEIIRLFSPELISITGNNMHLELDKMKQENLKIFLQGKSNIGIESEVSELIDFQFNLNDSSEVTVQMSPENKNGKVITFQSVQAHLKGRSILNLGSAKIKSLQLSIDENSAIQLSGETLKEFAKIKD